MKRRHFLKLAAGAAAAGVLAPVVRASADKPGCVLHFWHQWGVGAESQAVQRIADNFHARFPAITVTLTNITDQDQMRQAIRNSTLPDLMHFVLGNAVPQFAHEGLLLDLTDTLNRAIPDWPDRLYPFGRHLAMYDGKVFALPSADFSVGPLWNADLFARSGLASDEAPLTLEP